MVQKTLTKTKELFSKVQSTKQCVHHWIIAPPVKPVSRGVCKICGAEKDFDNFLPSDLEWQQSTLSTNSDAAG